VLRAPLDKKSPIQAVCLNWARTDLCGGRSVMTVPTAITVYRRGRGSSIQGKVLGNNVGKLPWAAGTGNNLQGLSKRG
jgi:hypothetical protein